MITNEYEDERMHIDSVSEFRRIQKAKEEMASTKEQALDYLKKIRFYADELIKIYGSTNKG